MLCSLCMSKIRGTGFTPFFIFYGAEAVLPTDLDYGVPKVQAYDPEGNERSLQDAMDQLEKHATWCSSGWPSTSRRSDEDLVLRLVQSSKNRHKLSLPSEEPYIVS
ncbi:unnamed protein product [Urochloa humidicola]